MMMMMMKVITITPYRAHINIYLTPGTQEGLPVQFEKSAKLCLPQQLLAVVWLHRVHPNLLQNGLQLPLIIKEQ